MILGAALLSTYLLAFMIFGSISHRIHFIGSNAQVRSSFSWVKNYYLLLFAFVIAGIVLLLVAQAVLNLDKCMENSLHLYTNHDARVSRRYSKLFGSLVVVSLCTQLVFIKRIGSRSDSQRTQFSFDLNWEAVSKVCMFHIGCRTIYFICVCLKQLLDDSTCRPVGIQANSISFDAQYGAFWLLAMIRLPVGLSSFAPNRVGSYSFATYLVRACQGYINSSELLYLLTSMTFVLSQMIVILYFDFGNGAHTLRQIIYGILLGILGHGIISLNVDKLFQNTPHANMPTNRNHRIRRLVGPVTNSFLGYIVSGAFAVRVLTFQYKTNHNKSHTYLVWREVVVFGSLFVDFCIMLLFIYGVVRKGARRQGYVRYAAVLGNDDELEAGN
jgi:hypothetical protein